MINIIILLFSRVQSHNEYKVWYTHLTSTSIGFANVIYSSDTVSHRDGIYFAYNPHDLSLPDQLNMS